MRSPDQMCIRAVSREESGKVLSSCRSIDSDPRFIPVARKVYANKHYYGTTKLDFSYNFIYFLLSLFAVFILQLLRNMVKRFFFVRIMLFTPQGKSTSYTHFCFNRDSFVHPNFKFHARKILSITTVM